MRSYKYLSSKFKSRKKTDFIEELKECYNKINVNKMKDPTREILEAIKKCKKPHLKKLQFYSELGGEIPKFDSSVWSDNIAEYIKTLQDKMYYPYEQLYPENLQD